MTPSSELFRRLAESSRDGLWLLGAHGETLYANDRMGELLGYTPEEMATVSAIDVHDDEGKQQFTRHLADMRAGHPGEDNLEAMYVRADGRTVWLLVTWHPVRGDDGEVMGWLHRYAEYTQRRALLDALQEREKLLATAQSIAQIGSWEWIVASDEVFWSEQLYKIYNVSPEDFEATYEGFLDFVHPEDRQRVTEAVGSLFEGAEEFAWDARVIAVGGEQRWVRGLGRAERDASGQVVRMGGTAQDITDRVLADQELAEAARRGALLRSVAEAANESTSLVETLLRAATAVHGTPGWEPMCVFVRDGDGPLAALEITDSDVELPEPDVELAEEAWRTHAMALAPAAGREETHCVVAMPVLAAGTVACVIELLADENPPDDNSRDLMAQIGAQLSRVAERERAAAVLAEARDQAMEASRLKSEFLATMSHEIRTPMNGVIGLADLLLQTPLDDTQRRHAEALHGAGLSLLAIINDILDVSKIEAGKLELEISDFDVTTVLDRVRDLLAGPASDKGLALSVTYEPTMPRWLVGDAGRVGQILANLGSNAVKFTDEGEVCIAASATMLPDGRAQLQIRVSDTGLGIAPEDQARLFEPFVQLDPSITRRHGGTGLGLTIVLQLSLALGGELTVDSEVGRGSTFVFTAPFEIAEGDPVARGHRDQRRARPADGPAHTVLVVEDNPVNQMVATGLLENAGYVTDVAEDGEVAVAKLAGEHPYAAVLMDIRMPNMDGFTATRAIRAQERPGQRVPIIAMTASALEGERERCLEAGMDDFLTKPVDISAVERVVRQWVDGRPAPADDGRRDQPETVLDLERVEMLAEMVKDGESLFHRSSGNFLASVPDHLDAITGAVADRDAEALTAAAHRFKGSALNLGLPLVGAVAEELELAGDHDDFAGTDDALQRLRAEVEKAVVALSEERAQRT